MHYKDFHLFPNFCNVLDFVLVHCKGGPFPDKKLAPCINEQELSTAFKNSTKGIKGAVALQNASFSLGLHQHSSTRFQCSLLTEALTKDVSSKSV